MIPDRSSAPLAYAVGWRTLRTPRQRLAMSARAAGPTIAGILAALVLIGAIVWLMVQMKHEMVGETTGRNDPLEAFQ